MFDHINVVLIATTHSGNIGAAARAMKTMGLSRLTLVNPKTFPCAEATARASGAHDILENARVVTSLDEALIDSEVVFGASARLRTLSCPCVPPREYAEKIIHDYKGHNIAILFGRESSGLTNEELDRCHYLVNIQTTEEFYSLNIAAAVQVLTYELRSSFLYAQQQAQQGVVQAHHKLEIHAETDEPLASGKSMQHFYQSLESLMIEVDYLDPQNPRFLMRRLHNIFNRIRLTQSEINILLGILAAIKKYITHK